MQENLNEEGLNNLNRALNCFSINNVQLRSARKTEALQCWKPIVQAVVDFLKERNDCFASLQILGTGSYYEKTKAGEPDEFDLMLVIDTAVDNVDLYEFRQSVPGVINDPPIGYTRVLMVDRNEQSSFNLLSATKLKAIFARLVKEAITHLGYERNVTIRLQGPAVTLKITNENGREYSVDLTLAIKNNSWPEAAEEWRRRDRKGWPYQQLVREICEDGCHLVPKHPEGCEMFWRYSFSAAEKKLFLQGGHGEENPCRKPVLRILKALKEELHLEPLNSYHLKTILLHECEAKPQPSQWNYSHLGQRFLDLLHRLENCLEQSNCPHYFIRNLNLFGAFNRQICLDLARKVRGVRLQAGEVLFRLSTKAQRRIIMKQALGESLGKSLEQDLEQDAESLLQQDSMQVLLQALERALTQAMEQALRQAWWPVQGQNRQQLSLIEQAIQALKQALGPQMEAIGYEIAQPILQPLVQVVEQVLDQTVCQDLTLLQAQAFGTFLGQVVWQNALQAIGKGLVQARDQLAEFTYTFSYNFLLHEFSGRQ